MNTRYFLYAIVLTAGVTLYNWFSMIDSSSSRSTTRGSTWSSGSSGGGFGGGGHK
jgi:hypothetical protein